MTFFHITEFEAAQAKKEPRNLEAEETFISGMEDLALIRGLRSSVIALDGGLRLVGLHIIFHDEADNE